MTHKEFSEIENYMVSQMCDSAHDMHHVYRVLNAAIDIYRHERHESLDIDVLIAACLLHDVGRGRQLADARLCHAEEGGKMAYDYLITRSWSEDKALHVKDCISSHRYRGDNPPKTIEAKILFDADKIDVCGALGIARTLMFAGETAAPLYVLDKWNNIIMEYENESDDSFFQEYNYKLKKLHEVLYTERAKLIAMKRQKAAAEFYEVLHEEIVQNYENGLNIKELFIAD